MYKSISCHIKSFIKIFVIIFNFLKANRVTTMHDFGYVALNMKYVNPEDSGTYMCRAINELGEAVTSATLFVQCKYVVNSTHSSDIYLRNVHFKQSAN